jgi:hypothetical protein
MDTFKKALTVCAAVSSFSIGAYLGVSGMDAISTAKVKAVMAAESLNSALVEQVLPSPAPKK